MVMVTAGRSILVDNDDQIIKMRIWCKENSIKFSFYTEDPYANWCSFHFNNDEDLMAFKLRWI